MYKRQEPGRTFRTNRAADTLQARLLPLAVLSRMSSEGGPAVFGEPLLRDLVDCREPEALGDRGGLETWLASIPSGERRGFCVVLGRPVLGTVMRSYLPAEGERQWGLDAANAAKKAQKKRWRDRDRDRDQDDDLDEQVDELEAAWKRSKGYIDYPWILSSAAACLKWTPSARSLMRCIVSNLAVMTPKWRNDQNSEVFSGPPYWGKQFTSARNGLAAGRYLPALGPSMWPWSSDAWLDAAGYGPADAGTTPNARTTFLSDLETLARDTGLCWRISGQGSGAIALGTLKSSVRSSSRWEQARLELMLPEDFLERLEDAWLDSTTVPPVDGATNHSWTKERVSGAIVRAGWSQRDLAESVGCSRSMISQILAGKRISRAMAQKFDSAFSRKKGSSNRIVAK